MQEDIVYERVTAEYRDRFITAIELRIPWARISLERGHRGPFGGIYDDGPRQVAVVARDLRNNFHNEGLSLRPEIMPEFGIVNMLLTGNFDRDVDQLRDWLHFYALHEMDEQIRVDGNARFNPHLRSIYDQEAPMNEIRRRYAI